MGLIIGLLLNTVLISLHIKYKIITLYENYVAAARYWCTAACTDN